MSKLSDILSQLKHSETPGNVTPGLKKAIALGQQKDQQTRRLITLASILVIIVTIGGIAALLLPEYLTFDNITSKVDHTTRYRLDIEKQKGLKEDSIPLREEKVGADMNGRTKVKEESLTETSAGTAAQRTEKTNPGTKNEQPHGNALVPTDKEKNSIPQSIQPAWMKNMGKNSLSGNVVQEERKKVKNDLSAISELHKASYYEKLRDYKNAISFYRKVLDGDPGNFIVSNKIAHLLLQLTLKNDALEYIDKALAYNAEYVPALINAGIIYAQTEKYMEAEEYLSKALSIEGQNMSALFNMALLYEVEGHYDKAYDYYSKLQRFGDTRGLKGLIRIGIKKK